MPKEKRVKRVVISIGPIPARLDSVKFITNRFKGGLALETAKQLSKWTDFEVTIVKWRHTPLPPIIDDAWMDACYLVEVADVFEYYDWFVAHAKDYDAFIMAAAVANLTPVKPYEGKFPSHNYKPGDEFDIKFMIAPRAIDAIKPLNPRACLIGYKLFDADTDEELIDIAQHTLTDAKANIIFANTPAEAKNRKIAVFADGTKIQCTFQQHVDLIMRAIRQEYYSTDVQPLRDVDENDRDIREALATVEAYETTFDKYGTVAVPVKNHPGMFATTSRGHKSGPVLIRGVDHKTRRIYASGKATLNAPALEALMSKTDESSVIIHRHFDDDRANPHIADEDARDWRKTDPAEYIFPGTVEEAGYVKNYVNDEPVIEPGHGYLETRPILPVDWTKYHTLYPEKYFKIHAAISSLLDIAHQNGKKVLEIGGNQNPIGDMSYDPYVDPAPGKAEKITWDDIERGFFPVVIALNSINYLSRAEIIKIIEHSEVFLANTFQCAPDKKICPSEYSIKAKFGSDPGYCVFHGLRLPDDSLMRHTFRAYDELDFESMGFGIQKYGNTAMLIYRGLTPNEIQHLAARGKDNGDT